MAERTDRNLRNLVVYQVYVRNYSEEGSFRALEADLDRIQNLGVDIIYLLPVHPIGKQKRQGSLGSPYAIADYRAINSELGTPAEFDSLVRAIHRRGMKCVMDIVYNHTSHDSTLAQNHPEWFYHRPDGSFGNRTGDWWDVIDLDYSDPASGLWEYQIETLKTWAKIVDGFRCDVAPLIPLEFWLRAREEIALINPDCFWIAESVDPSFIMENRARGLICHSDAEMFRAFDVCYDYDVFGYFKKCLEGSISPSAYADRINLQEYIYPDNYVKLRCLENHDQCRAKFSIPDEKALRNWTAFNYFQKGLTMIYAGQEWENDFRPSLFEKDTIRRGPGDLSPFLRALYRIKKDPAFTDSGYEIAAVNKTNPDDTLIAVYRPRVRDGEAVRAVDSVQSPLIGIFCLKGQNGPLPLNVILKGQIPDGIYTNMIDESSFRIEGGRLSLRGEPVIFRL
jgi:glycosidase